jgi:hypothetical protein
MPLSIMRIDPAATTGCPGTQEGGQTKRLRKEGLIVWKFNYEGVERKELITWAHQKVQEYFQRC